jgi:hypothetical protein
MYGEFANEFTHKHFFFKPSKQRYQLQSVLIMGK